MDLAPLSAAQELPYDPSATSALWQRDALPGFGAAMRVRVRFASLELPLWSWIAPLVIVVALTAAFAAAAVANAPRVLLAEPADTAAAPAAPNDPSAAGALAQEGPATLALASSVPTSLPLEATAGLAAADFGRLPASYPASQVFGIAEQRAGRELGSARRLQSALDRDPGLIQDPNTLSELRRMTDNPETARVVLATLAQLPAPLAGDLLYEVWTGTVQRNETTELARALLYSRDVRPKASAALAVALDLRKAETCDENRAILARAAQQGDRRSLHLLTKLQRRYGCGANKRLDCYSCLHGDGELESTIQAVKRRREPRAFARR